MGGRGKTVSVVVDEETHRLLISVNSLSSTNEECDRVRLSDASKLLCQLLLSQYSPEDVTSFIPKHLATWKEKKAKDLIAETLSEHLPIAEIAKKCSLSRSHFSRAFKHDTGISPKEWLMNTRIETAKRLLLESDLPLSQISVDCGFADQPHFTRTFHKYVGLTPCRWRSRQLVEMSPAPAHRTEGLMGPAQ